ncbi:MAG: paraquat-inducible protein A [Campylobacterota bacterium]|nr:paraquat-inducible protein A [Campylobacterota bacterium]
MNYQSACKDCGVIVEYDKEDLDHNFYCPRCKGLIYAPGEQFLYVIIMALAALVSFIPTLFLPVLTLDMADQIQSTTLLGTIGEFFDGGNFIVSIIILLTGIVIPLSMLGLLLLILVPLHFGKRLSNMKLFYKIYAFIRHWGMAEVYMISILVSVIKLQTMGDLSIDAGFFIFVFFLICFYITIVWFNPDDIWHGHVLQD